MTNKERLEQLEKENAALRAKVASDEAARSQAIETSPALDRISQEVKKIKAKGKSTANIITVTEKHDHKNISLWTRDGKRIGPMHQDNAIQTLERFANIGIMLSVDKPTSEQLEAYSKTQEYQRKQEKNRQGREAKDKSRKSGQMEKLANEIAKMSSTTVEAINHILKAHEVKSLVDAHK